MKHVLLALTAFVSLSAFAGSDEQIADVCLMTGIAKIALQAQAYGCTVDLEKVRATEVDNRWYNPSKYIWYTVPADCRGQQQLTKMVQYSNKHCQ